MQLYSVAQARSQALEAHAAAFSSHQVPGNTVKSQIVAFAQKTLQADGQITSKLHVIELGAQAAGGGILPPTVQGRRGYNLLSTHFCLRFPVYSSGIYK
jgi:hypothetical protein